MLLFINNSLALTCLSKSCNKVKHRSQRLTNMKMCGIKQRRELLLPQTHVFSPGSPRWASLLAGASPNARSV